MKDLGLTYEQALHGVQTGVKFEMSRNGIDVDATPALSMLKHLRTGLDARAADAHGLAELLMSKGIITSAEYVEHMRLAMNQELARYEEHCLATYGVPVNFR